MFEELKEILERLGIYRLEGESLVAGELKVYDDMVVRAFEQLSFGDERFWNEQWKNLFGKLGEAKSFDEIEAAEDVWSEL
ncbi:MAG: hypothetical protein LBB04_03555 [Oscillospiraceae bacterium]|jgi:hypothetical protein|nr:hypothetical protein [Oscillospiraceae bacterium]